MDHPVGGSGKRRNWQPERGPELPEEPLHPVEARPEVVAPLDERMGLVQGDALDDPGGDALTDQFPEAPLAQALGRDVDEPDAVVRASE